jgi:hypothetical protein
MNRCFPFLFFIFLASSLSSCSIGFNKQWHEAASLLPKPKDASGAWVGTWRSEVSGHHGELKAVVTATPSKSAPHDLTFRYRATYAKILSGSFTTIHHVDGPGKLTGSEDLGSFAGGVYRYEGKVTPTEFKATYTSAKDHGVFEMKRPQ